MKLRATGRYILVKTDFDLLDELSKKSVIVLTNDTLNRLKGGFQVHTILNIGDAAFDDEPPDTQALMRREGRQVITSRYPGHELDFDPLAKDKDVISYRIISSSEVHGCIAFDDEEGYDVKRI